MASRIPGALTASGSAAGGGPGDRGTALAAVVESLAKSRENESWGLMVEAAEDYQKWVELVLCRDQYCYLCC